MKVGFHEKYFIAEIKGIKDDDSRMYKLTNGKKTGKFLQLMTSEDSSDKMKWFKINQISNQQINEQEFKKFAYYRNYYKVPPVNKEMVEKKRENIYNARNYVY